MPDMDFQNKPLLVFVLGPPCAGKSTLCTALSTRYNLDHFSIGEELRSLVSSHPTGSAALIKPKFSASELELFAERVKCGTLGSVQQTPKYVKERIFPDGVNPGSVQILVDGFPRKVDRWETFKECVKDRWRPNESTFVIVLAVERQVAHARFVNRGRPGDVFERRYDEHIQSIREIVEAMKKDGVTVIEVSSEQRSDALDIIQELENMNEWGEAIGAKRM